MRLLIDECLHESLMEVAHNAGLDATHVNHLGLSGRPDWELAQRIAGEELTFVTNNRLDFIRLFSKMDIHAGLIVLVQKRRPPPAARHAHGGYPVSGRQRNGQLSD